MNITFLTADQFEEMARKANKKGYPFCAGFGLGRNISKVISVDGNIYGKLSPIADKAFAGTTQSVRGERTIREIESVTRERGKE